MNTVVTCCQLSLTGEAEELKKQYEEAMKEGKIPLQSANSVVMGVAGSGKTHSLAMAIEEQLPKERVSTTCTKAPIRTMTKIQVGVKEKSW